MEWISIDVKPPQNVELFVTYKDSFGKLSGYTAAVCYGNGFYSKGGGNYPITRDITHWLLPEPPKDLL